VESGEDVSDGESDESPHDFAPFWLSDILVLGSIGKATSVPTQKRRLFCDIVLAQLRFEVAFWVESDIGQLGGG